MILIILFDWSKTKNRSEKFDFFLVESHTAEHRKWKKISVPANPERDFSTLM